MPSDVAIPVEFLLLFVILERSASEEIESLVRFPVRFYRSFHSLQNDGQGFAPIEGIAAPLSRLAMTGCVTVLSK